MENTNFEFLLSEYQKLKDEQHKRIEFRDHMIYLTLAAIGAVFSFALGKPDMDRALLVLPLLCVVLGWTYLVNDQKISSIGTYIRDSLIPRIASISPDDQLLEQTNWEQFLKKEKSRKQRKWIQLFVDQALFCLSGLGSIVAFYFLDPSRSWTYITISVGECLLIVILMLQFLKYADLSKR